MARKRGARWVGDAIINDQRVRKTFATREEAEAFEKTNERTARMHTIGMLWPKWSLELWSNTRNERNSLRITDELIRRMGASTPMVMIDRAKIKTLVADLREHGNSAATINSKLVTLSRLMNYGIDEDVIESVPKIELQRLPQGRIRSLTADEEQRLFAKLSERYRSFSTFLLYTGCRLGEALALEWTAVDFANGRVTFWKTKTNKPRTVPLVSLARAELERSKAAGYAKPWGDVVYSEYIRAWRTARDAAGLGEDVVPHVLRHTCATRLGTGGVGPLQMQLWLGHANIAMTARYTHLAARDLDVGVAVLEPAAEKSSA
jgi:integrase